MRDNLNGDPRSIVDELTFQNYKHNRTITPETTPEQWAKVYGQKTAEMELRFQAELQHPPRNAHVHPVMRDILNKVSQ
jgi:hypothetical protein